ncbi:MAG: GTPase Era [Synergistetes bacterium]|nr:GTPase Era [Synergistota bacterium]MCX8127306.1 GTPase Era [Synergistota bacterium]MDW8191807.1 GTPase Era [Synergistota bacterium]
MSRKKAGFVTLAGRPNVGKSTLMNALLGKKVAIVSPKPQTTRTQVRGILTRDEGQIVFVDTPGIHKPKHLLGEEMVKIAIEALEGVDLILYVVEASDCELKQEDEIIISILSKVDTPKFLLINKIDLLDYKEAFWRVVELYQDKLYFREIIPISAVKGTNLDVLIEKIFQNLPDGEFLYPEDMITDQPLRFMIAEVIREKLFEELHQEIPYSVAVVIEEMEEREGKNLFYIRATIYVERESHRKIVIGKGGNMLKKIGKMAREEIEHILGNKRVFLELWVKVREDWRLSESDVRRLGFSEYQG